MPCVSAKKSSLVFGLVGFFLLLLVIAGALLATKLRQMSKNLQRQTPPNQPLQSPYESVVMPYATDNGQGVYMSAGVPPPGSNPEGAAAARLLPTKPPPYPESLPPAYDSLGYNNPVYGVNPSGDVQAVPLEGATAPPSVAPSQADSSNDK